MTARPRAWWIAALAGLVAFVLVVPAGAAEDEPVCFEHDRYYRNHQVLDIADVVDVESLAGRTIEEVRVVYSATLPGKRLVWLDQGETVAKTKLDRGPKRVAALELNRVVGPDFALTAEFHMVRDRVHVLEVQVVLAPEESVGP